MAKSELESEEATEIPINIELIHWLEIDDWNAREKEPLSRYYQTFDELASAIDEKGPLEVQTSTANAIFTRTSGQFEKDIVAIRQSGLNVRRILVRADTFDRDFGNFEHCVNMVLSNNAVGPEVEFAHLKIVAEERDLSASEIQVDREYSRPEIEATAALQMLSIRDEMVEEDPEDSEYIKFIFNIGFTAGRAFSTLQSTVTLEPNAQAAMEAKRKNIEKGQKSGSADRKAERLSRFLDEVEQVYAENTALRTYEDMVLQVAFDRAVPQGSYGRGQFENYCSALRTDSPFKERFDKLFGKSPK